MEKITLMYECPTGVNEQEINEKITFTFDSEGMDVYDFADNLRHFMLAIGYHPDSVNQVFQEY